MIHAEYFEVFLREVVNLNKSRVDQLESRVGAVTSYIETHDKFESLYKDFIPAGSWAHRTIIKPVRDHDEFDADVMIEMSSNDSWEPRDYLWNLYWAFRESDRYKDICELHTRCVRVKYKGDFHIDVVPFVNVDGVNMITNRREPEDTGRFEASFPDVFNSWIEDKQSASNGQFVKVARLVKYLRDYKDQFSCKSIILMTLLGQEIGQFDDTLSPDAYADVPTALGTLMSRLAESLPEHYPVILDPAGTGEDFASRYSDSWNYDNFRESILRYSQWINSALEATDEEDSILKWQKVFGDKFQPSVSRSISSIAPLSASVPWGGEVFIDQPPFGFTVELDRSASVRINARCTGRVIGDRVVSDGFRKYDLKTRSNKVAKNMNIDFRATISVAEPYDLYWKIRNGGEEASKNGQLRGDIHKDNGSKSWRERTAFRGTHYVDCYVVKGSRVIAKAKQLVIVT